MTEEREDLPFKARKRTSVLGAVLALGFTSRRHKGAPAAIARCLGDRLAEVLPPEEFTVDVKGPVLDVKSTHGFSCAGMPGMLLMERGTPEEKLTRVFMQEATVLQGLITRAPRQGSADNPVHGARLPSAFFDPHVVVTDTAIDVWWGGADPEQALVRLRPIARAEIGL
ncbi:MAG TPA: hypothetical protein VH061_13210 [Solirubrobacteraceae bacterium]|jgi:hypothetical protein|nr:hypothetical protein [Solirubrobacteraceae bacterium]